MRRFAAIATVALTTALAGVLTQADRVATAGPAPGHAEADAGSNPEDAAERAGWLRPRRVTSAADWYLFTAQFHTTRRGAHLVTWSHSRHGWTAYRFYNARWKPTSATLWVPVTLEPTRATRKGFVAHALRWAESGKPTLNTWVRLQPRAPGVIQRVSTDPPRKRRTIRSGDLTLPGQESANSHLYRTATNRVLQRRMPPWYRNTRTTWNDIGDGSICSTRYTARIGTAPIRRSLDNGVSWQRTPTTRIRPRPGATIPLLCYATRKNTIVVLGDDNDNAGRVVTLDRRSGAILSSHRLGSRIGPQRLRAFPDGTLVTSSNRYGIYVGTDHTNRRLTFRRAPGGPYTQVNLVGRELWIGHDNHDYINVSKNRGATWRAVDLRFARP